MEKEANYIVAIDMGTSKVVTLVGLKADDGKISIISHSCSDANGIARGDIKNIDQIVRSVQESITAISKESGIKICEAYVGLSGQHIKCQQHDGYVFITNAESEIHEEDVYKLSDSMRNIQVPAGEAIIHILPQNYILDDDTDISDPVGMIGNKLEGVFNIVTGEKKNISLVDRCLKRVEVEITEVILSSLASAEAVLVDDEKELGVAVVDIGGGTCDVCIYYDKTIRYLGVIPIGGNIINKDIKSYGVLERHVEKLKIKFGSALSNLVAENQVITLPSINSSPSKEIPQKTLASIIEARMMDVIDRVDSIITNTGFKDKLSAGIVLTGGGAMLKDLDKLFAQHLGCDVRIGMPNLYVSSDSSNVISDPKYSTAIGLLLKGMVIGRKTRTIVVSKPRPIMPANAEHNQQSVYQQHIQEPAKRTGQTIGSTKVKRQDLFEQQRITEVADNEISINDADIGGVPDKERKPSGLGTWLRKKTEKVREIFEADDELEDNSF